MSPLQGNLLTVSATKFISIDYRRRSLQFHYAASDCKPTKCPKKDKDIPVLPPPSDKPHYFDCDPSCQEPEYWYYKKAEILVCGKDFGGDFI